MAGRAGIAVAQRGQRQAPALQPGVTVEEMRQASIALMQLVSTRPVAGPKSRDVGRLGYMSRATNRRGTDPMTFPSLS